MGMMGRPASCVDCRNGFAATVRASSGDSILAKKSIGTLIGIAMLGALQAKSAVGKVQPGISHTPLLQSELRNTQGQEVTVWDTKYAPGAVNPRHAAG